MSERPVHEDSSDPALRPRLTAVVVHWNDREGIESLVAAWPRDPRCELVVVDNSDTLGALPAWVRRVDPGRNLGFAAGSNRGRRVARGDWLLFLNPDARPERGALDALLAVAESCGEAAGLVPALIDEAGESQHRWQLQRLPTAWDMVRKAWLRPPELGPAEPPDEGTPIDQPAAAALALRSEVFDAVGGFDESFHPAWFEDVDLARRLRVAGHPLLYVPAARFVHAGGATLGPLAADYPWLHYCNLDRYMARHHPWARWVARGVMVVAAAVRLPVFALSSRSKVSQDGQDRSPRGQWLLLLGALSGFRSPRSLVDRATPAPATDGRGSGHD